MKMKIQFLTLLFSLSVLIKCGSIDEIKEQSQNENSKTSVSLSNDNTQSQKGLIIVDNNLTYEIISNTCNLYYHCYYIYPKNTPISNSFFVNIDNKNARILDMKDGLFFEIIPHYQYNTILGYFSNEEIPKEIMLYNDDENKIFLKFEIIQNNTNMKIAYVMLDYTMKNFIFLNDITKYRLGNKIGSLPSQMIYYFKNLLGKEE